ncbi:MAG: complex I subunit 4 family protein [Candidatus Micrarchaeia archaeon]
MLLIPVLVLLPLLFIIPVLVLDRRHSFAVSVASAAVTLLLIVSALALAHYYGFGPLESSFAYISSLGIGFSFSMNAFTELLALMTGIVFLAAAISAKSFIKESEKLYNALFLISASSTLGVFLAGNFFLLYVFWEISEFAMFFIIYIFGAYDRRYAAIKFIIFSMTSSLLLLIGIMLIYSEMPVHTFSISEALSNAKLIPAQWQLLILVILLVAFMIKMPIFPFHTWLPDAHTEAPAPGSMILAGVLLKFGGYGMLLAFLMLPIAAKYSFYLALLFALSIIYAGFVTLRQEHFKRAIAYTSVVDMGIAALGLATFNTYGYAGALYAMLSHGIVIALMFLIAGTVDESFGTLLINKLRGIAKSFSGLAYAFIFGSFAMAGLPLTAGFVGDLLVFTGATKALGVVFLAPLLGLLLISVFMFWLAERMFFNISEAIEPYAEVDKSFAYAASLLIASTLLLGILPEILIGPISTALAAL